jgi:DNA mismatch repair protein MutS2
MADRTPGILNGSMEFDLKKLRPLYRLHVGKPGSSYTFLVAERSGLPRELIREARKKVNRKNLLLEKLLTEVEHDKAQLKKLTGELETKTRELNNLIRKNEALSRDSEATLSSKEQKLKKQEERLIREAEERFRNFLKEWRKTKDKKEVFNKYYRQFVQKKKQEDPKVVEKKRREKLLSLQELIRPGVVVRLENGSMKGIVEQVDDEKAYVIFGNVKAVCDLINLVPA